MSTQFATRVICYCIGDGALALKGSKSKPVLKITRAENDQTYLDHQIRTLRRLHPGPMETVWHRAPGKGFYDDVTAYVKSPLLWPAYEALYPQDKRCVTAEALDAAGWGGLVALWCDTGVRFPQKAEIVIRNRTAGVSALSKWAESLGHPCRVKQRGPLRTAMVWDAAAAATLVKALRPCTHPTKRSTLWPDKGGAQSLYACR